MTVVRKLRLTVECHSDESPMSYLSRLSAWNGMASRQFCNAYGFRFQGVVDGDEATLHTLATLGGFDRELLLANAFVKSGPLEWAHRGEIIHRGVLRRARITICPACALGDIKASPRIAPEAAVYGRAIWLFNSVHVCAQHSVPLELCPKPPNRSVMHDFAQHAKLLIPHLDEFAVTPQQDPGPLQRYVLRRLEGSGGAPLLDRMRLSPLVRLCETAGAMVLFPNINLKKLTGAQKKAAGDLGCEAITGGAEDFRSFLADLRESFHRRASGPHLMFGKLHTLLSITLDEPEFEAVREVVRDYIVEHSAIESGHYLFGKPAGERKLHSVLTLARAASVHPNTMRRHLRAAGLVSDDQMDMSDHKVLVDAEAGMAVANPLAGALSTAKAIKYLNVTYDHMSALVRHGFMQPRHRAAVTGGHDRYAVADLDEFLIKLGVRSPIGYKKRLLNIPTTAKQCCRSAADVIRLIFDGKLETWRVPRVRGYLSVLVDPDSAAKALHGAKNQNGVSLREVARRIGTSDPVLNALIAQGHVASFIAAHPVNKYPQTLIAPAEIERFRQEYVSLWALSKQNRLPSAAMKARLDTAGVEPAYDPATVGARFYSRAEVHKAKLISNERGAPKR
jgi:TniQ